MAGTGYCITVCPISEKVSHCEGQAALCVPLRIAHIVSNNGLAAGNVTNLWSSEGHKIKMMQFFKERLMTYV